MARLVGGGRQPKTGIRDNPPTRGTMRAGTVILAPTHELRAETDAAVRHSRTGSR